MDEDWFFGGVAGGKGEVPALFVGKPLLDYHASCSWFGADIKIPVKLRNRVLHPVQQIGGFIAAGFLEKS